MDFYNDLITKKSWQTLQLLKKDLDFVLIGGWAIYLYAKTLKSKDIDLIIDYDQLNKLKDRYRLTKNERLRKYEARNEEIQIDIYLPFYSNLGVPVEEITKEINQKQTFTLPKPEMLLILKQYAYQQRKLSVKGQKDAIDIISVLAKTEINWEFYQKLLVKFKLQNYSVELKDLLGTKTHLFQLNLNQHAYARLKKKILPNL